MDYIADSNRSIFILGALAALIVYYAIHRHWPSVVSKVPGPPSSSWLYGKSQVSVSARMSCSYASIAVGNLPLLLQCEVGEVGTTLILQDCHSHIYLNLNRSV
jgi:hypothetical protein